MILQVPAESMDQNHGESTSMWLQLQRLDTSRRTPGVVVHSPRCLVLWA